MLSEQELDRLEKLEREATPGPFEAIYPNADDGDIRIQVARDYNRRVVRDVDSVAWRLGANDAELLAAIRNAAPTLLAAARESIRLAAEVARLKGLQHENSVLMQSRRELIRQNDRYREALKWLADAKPNQWASLESYRREVVATARTALTPEASHD